MYKAIKALAILALLATVAGAAAVLYGVNTMTPEVTLVSVTATPADQAEEIFSDVMRQVKDGAFTGKIYAQPDGLGAQDCTFVTYQLRLKNRGFFPAEWIALRFAPREDVQAGTRDYLQMDQYGANVLAAQSEGDISTTILTTIDPANTVARIEGVCYVFGQETTFVYEHQ